MEVFTGLVPNEYVGYHPMKCYNRNGWKRQGDQLRLTTERTGNNLMSQTLVRRSTGVMTRTKIPRALLIDPISEHLVSRSPWIS